MLIQHLISTMIALGVVLSLIALANGANLGKINAHPYQVSFREWIQPSQQDEYVHFCTGVILTEDWILSSASCFEDRDLGYAWAAVGTDNVDDNSQIYEINYAAFPEDYETPYADNIALVRIVGKIDFNENVKAIDLPTANYTDYSKKGEVTGWFTKKDLSINKILQSDFLPIISNEQCSESRHVLDTHICVHDKNANYCHEDIGAPLVVDNVVVGIESYVAPCAGGLPDVFTRVFKYTSWITETMGRFI